MDLLWLLEEKCKTANSGYLEKAGAVLLTAMLSVVSTHALNYPTSNPKIMSILAHPEMAGRLLQAMDESPSALVRFKAKLPPSAYDKVHC